MMKKTAISGTWKTPPNLVYAQQQQQEAAASAGAQGSSGFGTKMQLMGLGKNKDNGRASGAASVASVLTAAPPPATTYSTAMAIPSPQPSLFTASSSSSTMVPSASPIDPSPFAQVNPDGSDRRMSMKRSTMGSPIRQEYGESSSVASEDNNLKTATTPGHPTTSATCNSASSAKTFTSPEEKQRMLAHSRTMARLRRQQQRVLTDSLESEFFELCVSAAYLKAALAKSTSNAPLHSVEVDQIYQQATERSLEAMQSNIPVARSQELKAHAVSDRTNMPQAHIMPSLKLDDATAVYLAVTVGSRRESLSFSGERRKGALQWSTAGAKNLFAELNKDALAAILASKVAVGMGEDVLASRLRLTDEQKERLAQMVQPVRADVMRVAACQKGAEMLFTDSWLSLPKTEALLEQVRDTTTTEQLSKLISWSITNEAQIAKLSLGSVAVATPPGTLTGSS